MLKSNRKAYTLLLIPALLMMLFIQFMPMIYNLVLSVLNVALNKPNQSIEFVGLQNYAKLIGGVDFWNSVRVTITIGFSSVALQLLIGFALALLLDSHGTYGKVPRGMGFLRGMLFIPYMLMPIMVGLLWFIFADSTYGMFNKILGFFHVPSNVWFSNPQTALWMIVVMDTWQCTPMMMLILSSGLKSIDRSLYEAARVDGANAGGRFRFVTLPMMKPVLKVAISIRLMDVLRIYDTVFATTKGGPGRATEPISMFTYKLGFMSFKTSMGGAASLLTIAMIMLLSLLVIKVFSSNND